MCAKQL